MLTRFLLGVVLCAMAISANAAIYDDLNKTNAELFGLKAHWVGSDYTSGNWVDRIADKNATPNGNVSKDGNSVHFEGGYFQVAANDNPLVGAQDFTILVNFTPARLGAGEGGSPWYSCTGLVDMEIGDVRNDWGLEYNGAGQIVAGLGMQGSSDVQSRSTSTVTVGQCYVVGSRLSGASLAAIFDGSTESSLTLSTIPAPRASSLFRIGCCVTNSNLYYGNIGEVRLFNRALNTSEMKYYSAEMASDFEAVEYGQTVTNPAHTLLTFTSGFSTPNLTESLPAGIGVGGGNNQANVTLSSNDFNQINMTYLLPNGNLTTETLSGDFSRTLNILGGNLNTSGTFTTANDARIVMTGGNLKGQRIRLDGETVFQMTGGTLTLESSQTWEKTMTINTPFAVLDGGTINAGEVNLGDSSSGTLNFLSGTMTIANTNIGRASEGNFFQKGGKLEISGWFSMGDQAAGEGFYEFSDGTLNARTGAIGNRGTGSYVQKGGVATFTNLHIGNDGGSQNSGGAGSVTLQDGILKVNTTTRVGQPIGGSSRADNTKGYFLQSGGTFETPTLVLGNQRLEGQEYIFDLTGGTLKAGTISGSTNLLNLAGGTLEVQRVEGDLTNRGSTLHLLDHNPTTITGNFQQIDGKIMVELSSALSQDYLLSADSFIFDAMGGIELIFNPEELLPGMEIDITLATPNGYYDWLSELTSESDWGYYFFSDFNLETGTLHLAVNSGAIPEPSTWLMLCLGMMGLVYWKKTAGQRKAV